MSCRILLKAHNFDGSNPSLSTNYLTNTQMITKYQLDTSIDVQTAIQIAEELRVCSIDAELIEVFNEKMHVYEDLFIEVNLDGLDVEQAFKTGMIVEEIISYAMDMMWQERRAIEQQEYYAAVNDGSDFKFPFTLQDYQEIDF